MVDRAFGYIGLGIGILFLIVFACVAVFLIFYFRRKNKKEIKEDLAPQPIITKTDKKICKECDGENRADSKYCSLCGYTL